MILINPKNFTYSRFSLAQAFFFLILLFISFNWMIFDKSRCVQSCIHHDCLLCVHWSLICGIIFESRAIAWESSFNINNKGQSIDEHFFCAELKERKSNHQKSFWLYASKTAAKFYWHILWMFISISISVHMCVIGWQIYMFHWI